MPSPGEGNGNPLHYSNFGNPMVGGAWQATVRGVTKELDTTQQLKQQNYYFLAVGVHPPPHLPAPPFPYLQSCEIVVTQVG